MTNPTLLDAAREAADVLEDTEPHVGAYLWEKHGYADIIAQTRAAIDREAERQEIIEGLVEDARGHEEQCCYCCATDYGSLEAALARYDAMKEADHETVETHLHESRDAG